MKLEQFQQMVRPCDVVYGYTKYIRQLDCPIFNGDFFSKYPGVSIFWDQSTLCRSPYSQDMYSRSNPNTRAFKGFLVHTIMNGGVVYFILNDADETSDKFVNEKDVGCAKTIRQKQITKSELAFICRYWDVFFRDRVKFFYYDIATNELTATIAPWENKKASWVTYYQESKKHAETVGTYKHERQILFSTMFSKISKAVAISRDRVDTSQSTSRIMVAKVFTGVITAL